MSEDKNFERERQVFAPLVREREPTRKETSRGPNNPRIYQMSPEYTRNSPSFFRSSGYHADAMHTKHEIVDASIVVYGLSGIMCEKEIEEPKASKKLFGWSKSKGLASGTFQTRSMDSKNWSSSTLSSRSIGSEGGGPFAESDSNPVNALVSITTSYSAQNMDYETFLPSIPLHCPSIDDLSARYTALWPAFMDGEIAKDRSSFSIVRTLQESRDENGRGHLDSKYVHETVDLSLSLSMGTEMIPLGTASVVLSGEEEVEVKMNVPARPFEQKPKGKLNNKSNKNKSLNKDGYFSSKKDYRYFLEENATLRIGVQVITEKAKKRLEKEQRRHKKVEQKKLLLEKLEKQRQDEALRLLELRARMERITSENSQRRLRMKREIYYSKFDDDLDGQASHHLNGRNNTSRASSLMCAMPNMLCAEEAMENRGRSYKPTDSFTDDYEYGAGLDSTISSVSHSMYESEMGSGFTTENETHFTDYEY